MKKTKVIHLGGSKFISLIKENIVIVVFTVLFSLGVLIGSVLCKYSVMTGFTDLLSKFFIISRETDGFFGIFFSTFLFNFVFLFATYLLGTSVLGMAFIPCIMIFRGLLSGLMLSNLYSAGIMKAIVTNLLTFIPGSLITVPGLICASNKSLIFSYNLGKLTIGEGQSRFRIDIKHYLFHFSLITLLTVFGAFCESFLSISFRNILV